MKRHDVLPVVLSIVVIVAVAVLEKQSKFITYKYGFDEDRSSTFMVECWHRLQERRYFPPFFTRCVLTLTGFGRSDTTFAPRATIMPVSTAPTNGILPSPRRIENRSIFQL